jgi:protease IV
MQKYSKFFDEIFSSPMVLEPSALTKYLPIIKAMSSGSFFELPEKAKLKMSFFDDQLNLLPDQADPSNDKIAVIPIEGVMTREGSWYDVGTNDIAEAIQNAFDDDSIQGLIIRANSPGGSVDSIFPLKAVMAKKNKPVVCAVDSYAMSCAYYMASLTDKIFAVDNMANVGSIGVMATLYNYDELYKQMGIKVIKVIPPESSEKNKPYNEAVNGNTDQFIKEELTPWAVHFQDTVKANRANLNLDIPGTLNGRAFFANYGTENGLTSGLIDGIMPFDDIVQYVFNQANNQSIKSIFNN